MKKPPKRQHFSELCSTMSACCHSRKEPYGMKAVSHLFKSAFNRC